MNNKGQTLLEMLIAFFVITTGVFSLVALNATNVTTVERSKDLLIASNLAREGIEIVKNKRDSNWLYRRNFDYGLIVGADNTFSPYYGGYWFLESRVNSLTDDTGFSARVCFGPSTFGGGPLENEVFLLYFGTLFGSSDCQGSAMGYSYSMTKYKRMLTMNKICRNNNDGSEIIKNNGLDCDYDNQTLAGIQVFSEVLWLDNGRERILRLEDRIYDWR